MNPRRVCISRLAFALLLGAASCTFQYGARLEPVTGNARQPTLNWRAFPSPLDLKHDYQKRLADITDVTYELRVFAADDGRTVYSRTGLSAASHRIEAWLRPERTYHWTVRPRFLIDGNTRVGHWSANRRTDFFEWRLPIPLSAYPSFRIPSP